MPTDHRTELREQREQARRDAQATLDVAASENRDLTAEEAVQVDALQARVESLAADIVRWDRQHAMNSGAAGAPIGDLSRVSAMHDLSAEKPWGADTGAAFGEQLQAIYRAQVTHQVDHRLLAAAQGAGEATPSDGGFLVGLDRENRIELRMNSGDVWSRVERLPISGPSNGLEINVIDESSRATGSRFGGVQGYWVDEGTAPTATKPTYHKLKLKLNKLAALGYATDELLQDAALLEAVMMGSFGEELLFMAEDAVINGTGSGQPTGIVGHAATVSVAKETGQAAATIVKANIDKMWARMYAPSRRNAVWLINQDVEPQLEALAADVGTGGVPVYLPPGGIADTPNARLKGRPLFPVEYCATLGTVGDILLVDLSQYLVIEKGGVNRATSLHVAFTTDEMAFRATYRTDGQPKWRTVLTPFKGTNTLAPFVSLATRA